MKAPLCRRSLPSSAIARQQHDTFSPGFLPKQKGCWAPCTFLSSQERKGQKGFIFSMDAIIALALCVGLIAGSMQYLSGINSQRLESRQLSALCSDFSKVAEKSGIFKAAVEGNSYSGVKALIEQMPNNLCLQVEVYGSSGQRIANAGRSCKASKNTVSAKRIFYANGSYYYEITRAWWRP